MSRRNPDLAIHLGALSRMGLLDGLIAIAKEHHVLLDHVMSNMRSQNVTKARIACYLHLRDMGLSYTEIGKIMLRDHTTVLSAVKKYSDERRRERDDDTDDGTERDPQGRKAS